MSPFNYADKIKPPIRLMPGDADDNQGTFPIESERFYEALKGQGATVRLKVWPPTQSPRLRSGKESLEHMLWGTIPLARHLRQTHHPTHKPNRRPIAALSAVTPAIQQEIK